MLVSLLATFELFFSFHHVCVYLLPVCCTHSIPSEICILGILAFRGQRVCLIFHLSSSCSWLMISLTLLFESLLTSAHLSSVFSPVPTSGQQIPQLIFRLASSWAGPRESWRASHSSQPSSSHRPQWKQQWQQRGQ